MKKNPLLQFGTTPVTSEILYSCFGHLAAPDEKIRGLEKGGQLVRLKRGMYVVSEDVSGKEPDLRVCANHIYGPSYISLQWALAWYDLIPERVRTLTSVTTKHSKRFVNDLGNFIYKQVPKAYFPIGVKVVDENGASHLIATPEKALCDTIIDSWYVPCQSIIGLYRYLEEDIRFYMDALKDFDVSIIRQCAINGKKSRAFENLIKIIKR